MKKLLFLLLLLLIPVSVLAKDMCDSNDIVIQSILLENSTGHLEELNEASIANQKINLGLKMDVVGDSAEYKIVVKNNSNEDYYFDERALNIDMESVNYEVSFDDNTSLIKAGEEKAVYLKISYKEQMDASNFNNGIYDGTQVMKLSIMTLENPFTGRYLGLLVFISLLIGFFILYRDKKKTAYLLLLVGFSIPFTAKAICKYSLEVNTNFVIDARNAIFLPGQEFNIKVKQLVGDDTSTVTNGYRFKDQLITAIRYSEEEPDDINKEDKNIVSILDSEYVIYMWFDNGTLYWWSEDKTPALNDDSSYLLSALNSLTDISGLQFFDTTKTTNMLGIFLECLSLVDISVLSSWNVSNVQSMWIMFGDCFSINSLDSLTNWDVSNVTEMRQMFQNNTSLTSLVPLKKWDVSKVQNMIYMFYNNKSLSSLSGLEDWDVSSVENLSIMFANCTSLEDISALTNWKFDRNRVLSGVFAGDVSLTSIEALKDWNISNVYNIGSFFAGCTRISDFSPIKDWDTSNVTTSMQMFYSCTSLDDLTFMKNWDTSKITDMSYMFRFCSSLESLEGLENWDVSSVTNYNFMFDGVSSLVDSSSINDWNIQKTASFSSMFANAHTHPEFSKVSGTWSNGTFAPSNS